MSKSRASGHKHGPPRSDRAFNRTGHHEDHDRSSRRQGLLASILAWFTAALALYQLALRKITPADFASLRRTAWAVKDHDYAHSFRPPGSDRPKEEALHSIGNTGFSGSVGALGCVADHSLESFERRVT